MQIISAHKNTDFDALASLVAASVLYPGAHAILPSSVNQNVRSFLSIHKDIFQFKSAKDLDLSSVYRGIISRSDAMIYYYDLIPE